MKTAFVNELGRLLDTLPARMNAIPENEFSAAPAPGKWSKKQILGHLIDSALNNTHRFVRGQHEDTPHIVYHQDEWVREQAYDKSPAKDVIAQWEMINRRLLAVVQHMPDSNLTRQCNTGKDSPELHTLDWLIDDYLLHLRHHLAQITGDEPVQYPAAAKAQNA